MRLDSDYMSHFTTAGYGDGGGGGVGSGDAAAGVDKERGVGEPWDDGCYCSLPSSAKFRSRRQLWSWWWRSGDLAALLLSALATVIVVRWWILALNFEDLGAFLAFIMADPLSIVASVIGIASAALKASATLYELIETIQDAPAELSAILNDTVDFQNVISSLRSALEDDIIQEAVASDPSLTDVLGNLKGPLNNCQRIIEQVRPRVERNVKPARGTNGKRRMASGNWWYFWRKGEIREYMNRLHYNKTTLDTALTAVVFRCSLQGVARKPQLSTGLKRQNTNDTDAGYALKRYVQSVAPDSTTLAVPFDGNMKLQSTSAVQLTPSTSIESPNTTAAATSDPFERLKKAENQRDEFLRNAKIGDDLIVELMLEQGTDVNVKGPEGKCALHYAAEFGNDAVVRKLLDHNADPDIKTSAKGEDNDRKFRGGITPLHWAAARGHEDVIEILLQHKADVNILSVCGRSCLQEAIRTGHTGAAKLLIQNGADVSVRDEEDWTPMHEACFNGRFEICKSLLEHDCDFDSVSSDQNWLNDDSMRHATPLFLAAYNGHTSIVKLLVGKRARTDVSSRTGDMPIHVACWRGHLPTVKFLLEEAGSHIEVKDPRYEETPLLKAASTGRASIILYLLNKGADPHAKTYVGRDALQHAKLHQPGQHPEAVAQIQNWLKEHEGVDEDEDAMIRPSLKGPARPDGGLTYVR